MPPFTPVLLSVVGSIHAWSYLHPVLVIKSMVPSCTYVLVSVVGSNSCSHLHPVLLAVVGSNPWSDLHPVLVIKYMVPFTPCTCVCCGSNPWSDLHPVLLSLVGSNPWCDLHPAVCFRIISMVPFTLCMCVCCAVNSLVPFIPCNGPGSNQVSSLTSCGQNH